MGLIQIWEKQQERKLGLNEASSIFKPKNIEDVEQALDSMPTHRKERYILNFFNEDWEGVILSLINGGINLDNIFKVFFSSMDKSELELIIYDIIEAYLTNEEVAELLASSDLGLADDSVRKLLSELGPNEKDEILGNIIRDYLIKK
jgi:hypothetical protein